MGNPLDWLYENNPSVEEAKAFIKNPPDALMGMDHRWGNIIVPLHEAIYRASDEVILLLLEACPQAAAAKDEGLICFMPDKCGCLGFFDLWLTLFFTLGSAVPVGIVFAAIRTKML